jgi:hypothetical protein
MESVNQSPVVALNASEPGTTESAKSEPGCCGGAAPQGSGACCDLDAKAKAQGRSGCGCSAAAEAAPRKGCC